MSRISSPRDFSTFEYPQNHITFLSRALRRPPGQSRPSLSVHTMVVEQRRKLREVPSVECDLPRPCQAYPEALGNATPRAGGPDWAPAAAPLAWATQCTRATSRPGAWPAAQRVAGGHGRASPVQHSTGADYCQCAYCRARNEPNRTVRADRADRADCECPATEGHSVAPQLCSSIRASATHA